MKRRIFTSARLSIPLSTALVALLSAGSALAQTTYTWDQTAGGAQNWTTDANWNPDIVGGPSPVSGDTVDLSAANIAANTTLTLGADRTAEIWKFGDTNNTHDWTIATGNKIILEGTTPTIQVNTSGRTATLNNVVDGAAGLTKTGAGTLTLVGTNIYTGGTTINAGTVNIANHSQLGGSGTNITFSGSATLAPTASSTFGALAVNSGTATFGNISVSFTSTSGSGNITFNGGNNSTALLNLGNASTFTGALRNNIGGHGSDANGKRINFTSLGDGVGAGNLQIAGSDGNSQQAARFNLYGNAGPLTFDYRRIEFIPRTSGNGPERLELNNTNSTVAHKWVINTNLLNNADRNLNFQLGGGNTGDNAFAGTIGNSTNGSFYSGTGVLSLIKAGNGKWILSNTNTYSGTTTITAGILNATSSDALGNSSASNTLVFNGGTLQAGGAITSAATRGVTMTATGLIDTNGNAVSIAGVISGAGGLTKSVGAGTLTLTGTNTYAGTTTISTGTLAIGDGGSTGSLSASGAITNNATLTFNRSNTIVQGLHFGNVIAGNGAVTQIGSGTTILSGNNTYTGSTTVSAGTLSARHANALGTGGTRNVTVAAGAGLNYAATADAPLSITGTLGITGGAGTVIGGSIGSTTTGAQIAVTGDATATGAIGVNIHGISGVTPLAGTNIYTLVSGVGGGSSMSGGTYTLGSIYNNTGFTVGALSSTAADLTVEITDATPLTGAFWTGGLAGATNVWAVSDGSANSNWVTAAGGGATALVPGSGTDVTISATSVTTAPTATVLGANMSIRSLTIADTTNGLGLTDDGNILTIANAAGITMNTGVPASSIAARVALGDSQTWTNDSANTLTVSGVISGTFGLTTAGTGTITLGGANTYSGGTTVTAGTLNLTGSVVGTTTVNGGTLLLNNPTANAFANATTVNSGGSLKLGAANRVVDSAVLTVNSGGIFDLIGFAETINRTTGTGGSVTNTGTLATLTLTGAGTQSISNVFSGALNLSIQGTSTITLTGTSNYSGSTIIGTGGVAGSRVNLGVTNALPVGTAVTMETSSGAVGLDLAGFNQTLGLLTVGTNNGGAQATVTGSGTSKLTLTAGATLNGHNNGAGLISVPFLDLNNATQTFLITGSNNASSTLTVSSVIQNGAATITGGGTSSSVIFSGTNTYAGDTKVTAGILRLDNKLALQNSPVDTSGAGVMNANNGAGTYSLGGLKGTKNLALVITTGLTNITTLNLNPQTGTNVSYSGVIAVNGSMGLTKTGAGTQTLSGVNTYTGDTFVTQGTLALVGGSHKSAITLNGGSLGFTLGSPTTSTASLTLTSGTVKITGAVDNASDYLLMTASTITGTLTLDSPIPNYTLQKTTGDTQLKLVYTPGGSAYDTWASAKGLTGAPGFENAKDADPDKDGKNNFLEFAFNGDPLDPSDNGMIAGLVQDASLPAGDELTLVVAVRNTATFLSAGSPAVQTATVDGVTYTIQGTIDLVTIPGSAVSQISGPLNTAPSGSGLTEDLTSAGWKYHVFKLDASEGLPDKGFLRAKISE